MGSQFKIGEKVLLATLVPLLSLIIMTVWTWNASHEIDRQSEAAKSAGLVYSLLAKDLQKDVIQVQQWLTDISATRGKDGLDDGFDEAEKSAQSFRSNLIRFKTYLSQSGDSQAMAQIKTLEGQFESYYQAGREMAQAYVAGGPDAGNKAMSGFDSAAEGLYNVLDPFVSGQVDHAQQLLQNISEQTGRLSSGSTTLSLTAFFLALLISLLITRATADPVKKIDKLLRKIAEGDLSQKLEGLEGRHELGQIADSVNTMVEEMQHHTLVGGLHAGSVTATATELVKIRGMIEEDANESSETVMEVRQENEKLAAEVSSVKSAVEQMTGNIDAISTSASQLSENITGMAAASEEASANITTMASAAEEITANIGSVNSNLGQVDDSVRSVAAAVEEMTAALGGVRKGCQEASRKTEQASQLSRENSAVMEKLTDSAQEIGNVVEVINSIADQTNMLALNASIEAAGAGEAGKGFAVVANEVKELARQTGEATKMISDQVREIQDAATEAAERAGQVGDAINHSNQMNQEILQSVEEQTNTVNEISRSMSAVAQAAQDVTRSSGELNQAAEDVARAASEAALGTSEIARSTSDGAEGARLVAEESRTAFDFAQSVLESATTSQEVSEIVKEKMKEASQTAKMMKGSAAYFKRLSDALQNTCNALYVNHVESETGEPPFNIRNIKDDHLFWLSQLDKAAQRRTPLVKEEMPVENQCSHCRWLGDKGRESFSHMPEFNTAMQAHKETHKILMEAFVWQESNEASGGGALVGRYGEQLDILFRALDRMYIGEEGCKRDARLFFPWDDKLITTITFVDRDHKRLVDMINNLHRAMKDGKGASAIGPILDEFVNYTAEHFGREEKVFDKFGYPETPAHKEKHRKLVATMKEVAQDYKDGNFAVGIDLLAIAKDWLVGHIMGTDMEYVAFFRKHGVSEPPA